MKLEAHNRLLLAEAAEVTYEQYATVVSSLARNPYQIEAFDFKVPGALKKLWSELKEVGTLLKESANIGWDAIVSAFKEKSVFTLLKGVGFSIAKLLKAVKKATAIPANTLFAALDDMIEVFGSSKLLQHLDVHERVAKLDELIHRHPVLTKLTGVAVAGFVIWQFLHMSNTGNTEYDLELVDTVISCIHGDWSLADMFASKQGLKDISVLLFGIASGGLGLTSYGASRVESLLHFLGSHSGDAASIMIALFYAAAKKLKLKINYDHMPQPLHAALKIEPKDPHGRTSRWFHSLSGPERKAYVKRYPGTRFAREHNLILPKG
jgi:hypothetical protein